MFFFLLFSFFFFTVSGRSGGCLLAPPADLGQSVLSRSIARGLQSNNMIFFHCESLFITSRRHQLLSKGPVLPNLASFESFKSIIVVICCMIQPKLPVPYRRCSTMRLVCNHIGNPARAAQCLYSLVGKLDGRVKESLSLWKQKKTQIFPVDSCQKKNACWSIGSGFVYSNARGSKYKIPLLNVGKEEYLEGFAKAVVTTSF